MRRSITLAAFTLGVAAPVFAQESGEGGDGAFTFKTEATLVGAVVDRNDDVTPTADSVMLSALAQVERSDTFDNGLTLSWLGAVRLERDAPSRPAFAAAFGSCPAGSPGCATSGGLSPVSPATGISVGGSTLDEEGFVSIEAASVALNGPWGEGVLGLDTGVAARLDARAPTVLSRVSASSPGLDPTGLNMTRARNDVTGSSAKASYLSPRWLGLRLGVSYTPQAEQRTADFDPDRGGAGLASAELEDVWEGAVSFARQFAEQDLRVRAAVTYTSATSGSGLAGFGDYEAWGAGLELEHDGWIGGARWLSSNNAWDAAPRNYSAWEVGLVREIDGWRLGAEAGWSEDKLLNMEGSTWLVGVSREISHNLDIGLAYTASEADIPVSTGVSPGHRNASNDGLLVELTVRN